MGGTHHSASHNAVAPSGLGNDIRKPQISIEPHEVVSRHSLAGNQAKSKLGRGPHFGATPAAQRSRQGSAVPHNKTYNKERPALPLTPFLDKASFSLKESYNPTNHTLTRDFVFRVPKRAVLANPEKSIYIFNPVNLTTQAPNFSVQENNYNNMSYPAKYEPVAEAIRKIIPKEGYDDGSIGPVLVRLAWHASGTYDKATGTGGSNGATMRYEMEAKDSANNGLEFARKFLEPIKSQFPWMTYADLWTFGGVVAVEYMGGPKIKWIPGRVDYLDESNVPPNGRLPDGAQGQDHLRQIFYRMGFNDQEIVALAGAHNLGRTHADRSGFDGPWVPNPTQFSNTYFKLLLNEEWHLGKSPAGVTQYYDEDKELMMLPADYSLIQDPEFRQWVEKYAKDKDLFYKDFSNAFAKLIELGVRRGSDGLAKVNEIGKINGVSNKL